MSFKQGARAWFYIFTFQWKRAVRYLEKLHDKERSDV